MAYSTYTLDQLAVQIGVQLDDTSELFWTRQEKYYAIWEGLRVWGALTNYWRNRGQISITPTDASPYYDLSVYFSAASTTQPYRTRAWTLGQMVAEIQYALLEPANGLGAVMSGQTSITQITNAIQRARDRFVIDTHIPFGVIPIAAPGSPAGLVQLPSNCVYAHRAMWQDATAGTWSNLWRIDAWEADKSNYQWTIEPGRPVAYSESELSPLEAQLYPGPLNTGQLEIVYVASLPLNLSSPATTFNVPDEWVHAVKYGALADLTQNESQLYDPLRAQMPSSGISRQ